jgi:hypothetical protein
MISFKSEDYKDWPYLALLLRACEHFNISATTRAELVDFFLQQPPPFPDEPVTPVDAEALAIMCLPPSAMTKEDEQILDEFTQAHRW